MKVYILFSIPPDDVDLFDILDNLEQSVQGVFGKFEVALDHARRLCKRDLETFENAEHEGCWILSDGDSTKFAIRRMEII